MFPYVVPFQKIFGPCGCRICFLPDFIFQKVYAPQRYYAMGMMRKKLAWQREKVSPHLERDWEVRDLHLPPWEGAQFSAEMSMAISITERAGSAASRKLNWLRQRTDQKWLWGIGVWQWLKCHVWCSHPISEHLCSSPAPPLLNAASWDNCPSVWVPTTHMGELDWVPDSSS